MRASQDDYTHGEVESDKVSFHTGWNAGVLKQCGCAVLERRCTVLRCPRTVLSATDMSIVAALPSGTLEYS
eukprot:SAG11_NODE_7324_length_1160_cov_1.357210_1_plen_70_part_10